jgi:gliding motility-associated-like protein
VGATYLWQNGQTVQMLLIKNGGLYSVVVTKNGCVAKDTIAITPLSSPNVKLTGDTTVCRTATAQLTATGASNYKWWPTTGLSDSVGAVVAARPNVSTTYYLIAASNNGCQTKDSVTVTVTPMPAFSVQSSKPVLCLGDTAALSAHGGDAYTWWPSQNLSNPFDSTTAAFPTNSALYHVVIENFKCKVTDTLSLALPVADKPLPQLTKSNDINCFQGQATLNAQGGISYSWQPATGLNNPRSNTPVVTISTTTTYSVSVKTSQGCEVQDSITVYVNKGDDGSGFPVPSAFTPNGDGRNDCFGVRHWGAATNFSMNLYNRWGERVFHADDPSQCWDGIYKGVPQPGDVYVYWIKAKTLCGDVFRKGTFVLIR